MINVDREKTNGREKPTGTGRKGTLCLPAANESRDILGVHQNNSNQIQTVFISVCFTVMLSLFAITELDMSYVFTFAAIVIVNVIIWVRLKNNYRDLEKRKTNAAEKFCFLGETEVTMAGYDKNGNSLTIEQYPYEMYTAVYESKHLLILYSKTLCIVLPKSEFLKGTPRDAMLYLRKKLEK